MEKSAFSNLPPVSQTLLFPLAARARESQRPDALLRDPRAVEIAHQLETDIASIGRISSFDQASVTLRANHFDNLARDFLSANPQGLVVELGCGLDTRFERLDQGQMTWLGLDLPVVIALRQHLLPGSERCLNLPGSLLDPAWMDAVANLGLPPIFLAEGVFPYLGEADVKAVITALALRFPGAEIAFDIYAPWLVRHHNRSSGLLKETGARLNWSVNDPGVLDTWGLRVLDTWGYFDRVEPRWGLFNLLRFFPAMVKSSRVVHARLGPVPGHPAKN